MLPILRKIWETVFMKAICVLTCTPDTYFTRRLTEVVGEEISFLNCWQDALLPAAGLFSIRGCGPHRDDKDIIIARKLPAPVINPAAVVFTFRDKSLQSKLLG